VRPKFEETPQTAAKDTGIQIFSMTHYGDAPIFSSSRLGRSRKDVQGRLYVDGLFCARNRAAQKSWTGHLKANAMAVGNREVLEQSLFRCLFQCPVRLFALI
jgi:hypothetical protein